MTRRRAERNVSKRMARSHRNGVGLVERVGLLLVPRDRFYIYLLDEHVIYIEIYSISIINRSTRYILKRLSLSISLFISIMSKSHMFVSNTIINAKECFFVRIIINMTNIPRMQLAQLELICSHSQYIAGNMMQYAYDMHRNQPHLPTDHCARISRCVCVCDCVSVCVLCTPRPASRATY